jgi:NDP-sugar pyrophosphorylase family protein
MINIVIPMAGAGSRFALSGFDKPKPLIDILGKPMIQWVVENLNIKLKHRFIFICQAAHQEKYHLDSELKNIAKESTVIGINGLTQGAAATILFSADLIDNDSPLLIANSDQYVEFNLDAFVDSIQQKDVDGSILTMTSNDEKWSYIKYDQNKLVTEVREKEVISNEATVGIYAFKKGKDFVKGAREMIRNNEKVKGEYYVAPVYNKLIANGSKIFFTNIGFDTEQMNGLGTPEDLALFIKKMQK